MLDAIKTALGLGPKVDYKDLVKKVLKLSMLEPAESMLQVM